MVPVSETVGEVTPLTGVGPTSYRRVTQETLPFVRLVLVLQLRPSVLAERAVVTPVLDTTPVLRPLPVLEESPPPTVL